MISLDESGKTLLKRHARWWQRKESLLSLVKGAPLGGLWLPLADGTLAQDEEHVDVFRKDARVRVLLLTASRMA